MNLADLNKLRQEAETAEAKASSLKGQAAEVAERRKGPLTLTEALDDLKRYRVDRRDAIVRAEALLRDDLLRLAEMDLEGQARRFTAEARAKRAALAAFFVGEPESKTTAEEIRP